jgi:23S rRNA (uridine2552-2'-O)-methyltransferase
MGEHRAHRGDQAGLKSSKQWLRRHVTDHYVRKAKAQGYRSRAAFKLLEIDAEQKILKPGMTVVDLGAAPGGWSQVAAAKVKPGGRVIAIDLLPIAPISGVTVLKGDFREETILRALAGARADVVLSDVSPNLSGIGNVDQARALELSGAAIDFCGKALKPDGVFLVKAFQGEAFNELVACLKHSFVKVKVVKPSASRGDSSETYLLARGLKVV